MEHQVEEGPDPRIGMLLQEKYRIIRKLGEGGMGAVYEVNHELIGRRLALKCLHAQFASDPQVVARFQREAQASSMVGSEHIIEVTDMGRFPDGAPFMVLEFLDGQDLSKVLEKTGALPVSRVCHIMAQVCQALAAAHAKGIVHRDLKPENIYLITRKGDPDFVKVLDFGISKMKEAAESLTSGLTKTGMALGTPYYMAPEQAQGLRDVDHRTDVYALGVILFESLTGSLPYDADTYPLLMVKIMTEAPPLLRSFRPDLPAELEHVVLRAIAKSREERFQNVEELSAALQPFRNLDGVPIVTVPPARPAFGVTGSATGAGLNTQPSPATPTPGVSTGLSWTKDNTATGQEIPGARSKLPMMAAVAGVALLLVGGGAIALAASGVLSGTPDTPATTATPPPVAPLPNLLQQAQLVQQQQAAQLQQQQASGQNPTAPQAAEVEFTVNIEPPEAAASARFFILNGSNPEGTEYPIGTFSAPRSLSPVRVRVTAPRYRTVEQMVMFDRGRTLTYTLTRGRGVQQLEQARDPAPSLSAEGGGGRGGVAQAPSGGGGEVTAQTPPSGGGAETRPTGGGGETQPAGGAETPRPPTKTISGFQQRDETF